MNPTDWGFSVDGTLIQAWAGHKSDGGNFRGRKRSNETHESKTDPDAKLYPPPEKCRAAGYRTRCLLH